MANALLIQGIIAVVGARLHGIIVPLHGLGVLLGHEVAVAHAHHGIGPLDGGALLGGDETPERGGRLAILLHLEIGIAHAITRLLIEFGGVGPRGVPQVVVLAQCCRVVPLAVIGFGHPEVRLRVHALLHRILQRFLEEQRGIPVLPAFIELHPAVEGELLVGLLQPQVLILDLVQGGQRGLIVLGLQVHVQQELISLVPPGRVRVGLEVVLERVDGFVIGVQAQVVGQLGIVEEGIFGHLRILGDIVRLLEGGACVVLLAELQVAIGHVVGGELGQTVVAIGHQVELLEGLTPVLHHHVGIAQDVAILAGQPSALGALLQVRQGLLVVPGPVVGLPGQPIDLVLALHPLRVVQQGLHVGVQLIILPLQEKDLGDIDGHHLTEPFIVLELLEPGERGAMVAPFVVDMRGIVGGRHGVGPGSVLHLGELHDGLIGVAGLEESVTPLEPVLLQLAGRKGETIHLLAPRQRFLPFLLGEGVLEEFQLHGSHMQVVGMVLHEGVQAVTGIIVEEAHGTKGAVIFGLHPFGGVIVRDPLHHAFELVLGSAVLRFVEQFKGMRQVGATMLVMGRSLCPCADSR